MIDPKSLRIGNYLEKEMLKAIEGEMVTENQGDLCLYKGGESQAAAKAAASVAMKWIEKAFRAGENYEYGSQFGPVPNNRPDLKKWLELSGLTPTEPDTKELTGEMKDEGNYTVGKQWNY